MGLRGDRRDIRAAWRGRLRGGVWGGGWMTVDTVDNLAAVGEWLAAPDPNHEQVV